MNERLHHERYIHFFLRVPNLAQVPRDATILLWYTNRPRRLDTIKWWVARIRAKKTPLAYFTTTIALGRRKNKLQQQFPGHVHRAYALPSQRNHTRNLEINGNTLQNNNSAVGLIDHVLLL